MNTRRSLLLASFVAGSMAASCLPAAADPPSTDVMAQPCAGLINALTGCYRPYPYYYGGPLSGATYERYYGNYWPRSYWRDRRYHHVPR